ncbi:MAG: MgtC/SapB family protein [Candidatus Omnitrophota bacterium]|nr:MAG: MgtC/SapB family protein [Candidatus Omnitrophota bacterium]
MNLNIIILRLFIAVVCGAVIGLEREMRDKAAGLRTHILVCLGACLFGMLGLALVAEYRNADMLRLAQGLLIGIGFLGAGVIVREGASIKGLTTAAGIWVMGAIGLAVGVGYYHIALIGTIFGFLTITLFSRVEGVLKK